MTARGILIHYTSWRGQTRWRRVLPLGLYFGATEHHPEKQWLLEAIDLELQEKRETRPQRTFAMRGITEWKPMGEEE